MTRRQASLEDVAVLSGEELMRKYGSRVQQQLVDMIVVALKRAAEDEAAAIARRLDEAHVFARANKIPTADDRDVSAVRTEVGDASHSGPSPAAGDSTMRD